jgi:translin
MPGWAEDDLLKGLEADVEEISDYLAKKQSDFDEVMQLSREVIRNAGQLITMMHNGDIKRAAEKLEANKKMVERLKTIDGQFKYNTMQAYQEYAEASIFYELKTKQRVPSMETVGVEKEAYLMGLMDVEGELKREILEMLRIGKIKEAEWYFDTMKMIYDSTRSLRFAEAVLSGFRKKQDTARIQIENAGSEILMFKSRKQK